MAEAASKRMTPEEFFAWTPGKDGRYELVDGIPIEMMSGASRYHDRIVVNIILSLGNQLVGGPCQPATADTGVHTRIRGVRRPDVTVTCDEPKAMTYEAEDPRLVVEVISPDNVGVIWQEKLEEYRRRDGLVYILLVESELIDALLLTWSASGWQSARFTGADAVIELPEIACRLVLTDVYKGLTFTA
jgi:Uma2 family endonuclease